jgi:hypothetical protein
MQYGGDDLQERTITIRIDEETYKHGMKLKDYILMLIEADMKKEK